MIGRTHALAAFTALGVVYFGGSVQTMSLATVLVGLLANQIGAIAPDIDQPTAPLWRNLPIGGMIGKIIDRLLGGHRFLTHSLIGLAIFGGLLHLLLVLWQPIMSLVNIDLVWAAFMIGMLSHLVMDSFTKEGVPWLLPIPVKFGLPPIRSLRITSGKKIENFIIVPGFVAVNIFFYATHYSQLISRIHQSIT